MRLYILLCINVITSNGSQSVCSQRGLDLVCWCKYDQSCVRLYIHVDWRDDIAKSSLLIYSGYFGAESKWNQQHNLDSVVLSNKRNTVYPKKNAHGFCFAVLCYGYTLTDFPISIRLTSLVLWQSNDCPSASKATLMNTDKYFMWIHYERLHNHNKAKHNKTVCIFLGIYCNLNQQLVCASVITSTKGIGCNYSSML